MISLTDVVLKHKSKMTVDCGRKTFIAFTQLENAVLKFLRSCVDGKRCFQIFLACSRLSVNGACRMRPGDVRRAGSGGTRGKVAPSYFFHQTPLVPRPLFRSTPLTESLEQAKIFPELCGVGLISDLLLMRNNPFNNND